MIAFPHSMCMTYCRLGEGPGVASDTGHRGSMRGRAVVPKSFLSRGDIYHLFQ